MNDFEGITDEERLRIAKRCVSGRSFSDSNVLRRFKPNVFQHREYHGDHQAGSPNSSRRGSTDSETDGMLCPDNAGLVPHNIRFDHSNCPHWRLEGSTPLNVVVEENLYRDEHCSPENDEVYVNISLIVKNTEVPVQTASEITAAIDTSLQQSTELADASETRKVKVACNTSVGVHNSNTTPVRL